MTLKKDGFVVRISIDKGAGGTGSSLLCTRAFLRFAGKDDEAAKYDRNVTRQPNKRVANTVYQQFLRELRQGRVDYLVPGRRTGFTAVKARPSDFEVQAHIIKLRGVVVGRVAVIQNYKEV